MFDLMRCIPTNVSPHDKNNTANRNQNTMCLFWSPSILTDARQNTQNVHHAKKSQVRQCRTTRHDALREVTRSCKLTRCVNLHTQHRSSCRLNNSNQSWKELFLGKNAALPENINKKRESEGPGYRGNICCIINWVRLGWHCHCLGIFRIAPFLIVFLMVWEFRFGLCLENSHRLSESPNEQDIS